MCLTKNIKEHNHHYVLETFWLGNDYQDQNSRYFLFHKFFLDYTILLMYLLKELNENPSLNVFYTFKKIDGFNKMKV